MYLNDQNVFNYNLKWTGVVADYNCGRTEACKLITDEQPMKGVFGWASSSYFFQPEQYFFLIKFQHKQCSNMNSALFHPSRTLPASMGSWPRGLCRCAGLSSRASIKSHQRQRAVQHRPSSVRLGGSYRCWFVKKYCWLVCVREKYCSN